MTREAARFLTSCFKVSDFLKAEIELVDKENYAAADADELVFLLKLRNRCHQRNCGFWTGFPEWCGCFCICRHNGGRGSRRQEKSHPAAKLGSTGSIMTAPKGPIPCACFFDRDGIQMENIRAFMLLTQFERNFTAI